jgi:hypothetical protein
MVINMISLDLKDEFDSFTYQIIKKNSKDNYIFKSFTETVKNRYFETKTRNYTETNGLPFIHTKKDAKQGCSYHLSY